jgi:hypothetical protein
MRRKPLLVGIALLIVFSQAVVMVFAGHGYAPEANDRYSGECNPWLRGPEAAKIAQLRECPAPTTWGYDLPYTYAYGSGIPYYVGHNYGMPSGAIYENPANYPYGIPEPGVIYGDPEYAMLMNYGYSFPFHNPTYFVETGPVANCLGSPFAFTGPMPTF